METVDQAKILQATIEAADKAAKFADRCREHNLPWMERLWRDFANQAQFTCKLQARDFAGNTLDNQPDHTTVVDTAPNDKWGAGIRNPADGSVGTVPDERQANPLPWGPPEAPDKFAHCFSCNRLHLPGPCPPVEEVKQAANRRYGKAGQKRGRK